MTEEEMAEQYADGIATPDLNASFRVDIFEASKDGFLAGLKAGRPQWHKVADGDLPKDETRVLLYFGDEDYNDGHLIRGRFWCGSCGWFDVEEVIAWCEIPTFDKE